METLYYYLALVLSLVFVMKHSFHPRRNLPPSPLALPIIGHLHLIMSDPRPERAMQRLLSKHGPILFLRFGSQPILALSSPSAVKECFTKNDAVFAYRPRTMAGDCLSYNYKIYAFASYGDLWRRLRCLTVKELFSSNSLHASSAIREEETRELLRSLSGVSTQNAVDLTSWFSLLAFNILMRLASGERYERYETLGTEAGRRALDDLRENFRPNLPLNICDFLPILKWLGYKGLEKSMKMLHGKRDAFLQGLIDEFHRKKATINSNSETGEKKKSTLIETLFGLKESKPDFYSDDIIKSIILTMFVAGTETSAMAMESAISLLLNHPEALLKLRAEIDNQVGHGHRRLLNDSDLDNLPFLKCVIYEALRLHPPVTVVLPHYASEDCQVGGFHVPKGTILLVNALAMQRDPRVWEEPDMFKPERFNSMKGHGEMFKFVPFGAGMRACPGDDMAVRTTLLAVGSVIQCFDLEKAQPTGSSCEKAQHTVYLCTPRPTSVDILS